MLEAIKRPSSCLIMISLVYLASYTAACSTKTTEEVITIDAANQPRINVSEVSIKKTSSTPQPNYNIEVIGDSIAKSITFLHQHNKKAAVHSISEAKLLTEKALRENEPTQQELHFILQEEQAAQQYIFSLPTKESIKRLSELNKKVDSLQFQTIN